MPDEDQALVELGEWLRGVGYRFVSVTPATHDRVNAREANRPTTSLRDALGWSRPFRAGALPADVERLLARAGALQADGDLRRSRVRFSTLGTDDAGQSGLFVHSAHPTVSGDAVFFGPDTYRFVALLERTVRATRRLVDIGAGSGAGGLSLSGRAEKVVLADVNGAALRHARINAALSRGVAGGRAAAVEILCSDVLADVPGEIDTVIANPPYLVDPGKRLYRDGGGPLGFDLAVRIVSESMARLSPGGQLVLYTGSPVIDGSHPLRAALEPVLAQRPCRVTWQELDPDVFGEELLASAYRSVDRIAVVALAVDVF